MEFMQKHKNRECCIDQICSRMFTDIYCEGNHQKIVLFFAAMGHSIKRKLSSLVIGKQNSDSVDNLMYEADLNPTYKRYKMGDGRRISVYGKEFYPENDDLTPLDVHNEQPIATTTNGFQNVNEVLENRFEIRKLICSTNVATLNFSKSSFVPTHNPPEPPNIPAGSHRDQTTKTYRLPLLSKRGSLYFKMRK